MATTQKTEKSLKPRKGKRLALPIGIRLSLAFMIIILLTALIGILAVQQFSALTNTTTELNAHDLPEEIALEQLRSLLYQQRNLEQSLINVGNPDPEQLPATYPPVVHPPGSNQPLQITPSTNDTSPDQQDNSTSEDSFLFSGTIHLLKTLVGTPTATPTPTTTTITTTTTTPDTTDAQNKVIQQTVSNLESVLNHISQYRQQLLAFEQTEVKSSNLKDIPLLQKTSDNLLRMNGLSQRIQTLVKKAQFAQAYTLEVKQQEPLQLATIDDVTQLSTLEQQGATADAANAQMQSARSTLFVFALTALCLLLSILLAIIITRSLTKPLKVLLHTTEAIAAGNLEVAPHDLRTDEIGRLATAYDKMRLSLRSTIGSLRIERQQTQAVIDATADGVILVDAKCKILKCNPAAERLIGWQANEAIGRYCWEVLECRKTATGDEETTEQHPIMAALQTTGETAYLEMPIIARTGQQRWLAVSCAPMPVDENTFERQIVIGLHDISQLKAVEQMKSDFVAMVSHELRAPLTTVTGSVEMLSLLDPGADTESYQEVLHILDQQTRRLRQVVEEVLQLTRFDAGRLEVHLQPLSVTQLLQIAVNRVRDEWNNSDFSIILHEPAQDVPVWADSGLLEIVFRNLFDNARKYTPQGMPVEVETEFMIESGRVQIRIIDHGPGIPEDQLEHIFERFSRGTQSSYHWTRGYGLGLYIARELLRAHNGAIWVENRQEGACFVLSLWMVTGETSLPIAVDAEQSSVSRGQI